MGQTDLRKPSMVNANSIEEQRLRELKRRDLLKKRAYQNIGWWSGVALSLAPISFALISMLAHLDDSDRITKCKLFIRDFFASGSFLWIAVTLLATSLIELLLYGFNRKIPDKDWPMYKKFIIIVVMIMICVIIFFYDNIASPVNFSSMCVVSIFVFLLFAFSSRIVIYKLVRRS